MSITIFALMTVGQWFDIISDICMPSIVYRVLLYRMRVHVLLTNKNIYQALEYTDKLRNESRKVSKDKDKGKDKDKDKDKGEDKDKWTEKNSDKDTDKDQEKYQGLDKVKGPDCSAEVNDADQCKVKNNKVDKDTEGINGNSGGGIGIHGDDKTHRGKDHDRALRAVVDKRLTLLAQVIIMMMMMMMMMMFALYNNTCPLVYLPLPFLSLFFLLFYLSHSFLSVLFTNNATGSIAVLV